MEINEILEIMDNVEKVILNDSVSNDSDREKMAEYVLEQMQILADSISDLKHSVSVRGNIIERLKKRYE